jgi:hypothetical protein
MLDTQSIEFESFTMLKDTDRPKEPLRNKAARMWKNNNVRKKLAEEMQARNKLDPNADPEITEVIINEGRRDGTVNRFENKFKRDIRAMVDGHASRNLALYLKALEHRKVILLREKLRRLQEAEKLRG